MKPRGLQADSGQPIEFGTGSESAYLRREGRSGPPSSLDSDARSAIPPKGQASHKAPKTEIVLGITRRISTTMRNKKQITHLEIEAAQIVVDRLRRLIEGPVDPPPRSRPLEITFNDTSAQIRINNANRLTSQTTETLPS